MRAGPSATLAQSTSISNVAGDGSIARIVAPAGISGAASTDHTPTFAPASTATVWPRTASSQYRNAGAFISRGIPRAMEDDTRYRFEFIRTTTPRRRKARTYIARATRQIV